MKVKNVHVVNNMGKKVAWIIIGILSVLVIGAIFVFGLNKPKKIESIKTLYFTYTSGYMMNAYTRYELEKREDGYYVKIKPNGIPEEEIQEAKVSDDDISKIVQTLNEYKVIKWNNFHESDKYVLDGDSFSFSLITEEGIDISASGYMRWPKNYNEVKSTLVEIFDAYYKYDIKVYE